jgi:uncharacterized protein (TIGR03067 family)
MRRYTFAAMFFALACTATAQQPETKKKSDRDLIQGTWWIVGLESAGKQQSDKSFKGNSFTFEQIKVADTATLREAPYQKVEFQYSLDQTKSPKEINLTSKGIRALGIYKLDVDDLTICVSLGGSRPNEFATRAGGDSETFTLKRNRWERYSEKGIFSIDFPGRPTESKRSIDTSGGKSTVRILTVRNDMERTSYSVTITPLSGKLTPPDAELALDAAQKAILADLDRDANATVELESKLPSMPAGVSAARELTIAMRIPQSRDRAAMRVRLYVSDEWLVVLIVSGPDELSRSPSVGRFWNSFRTPADKRKEPPSKQR